MSRDPAALSDLEVLALDPRRDRALLHGAVAARLAAGIDVSDLYRALAERDPVALADLCIGPRAPAGPGAARAALAVLDALEALIRPRSLYPRLATLAGPAAPEVVAAAAARHPAEGWVVELALAREGERAGRVHLHAAFGRVDDDTFAALCDAYARAGARRGLVEAAAVTGSSEPAAALALAGALAPAAEAAAAALSADPSAPVVPLLAGAVPPDELEGALVAAARRLRDLAAARALRGQALGSRAVEEALDRFEAGRA